jgi:hypothetical protein
MQQLTMSLTNNTLLHFTSVLLGVGHEYADNIVCQWYGRHYLQCIQAICGSIIIYPQLQNNISGQWQQVLL